MVDFVPGLETSLGEMSIQSLDLYLVYNACLVLLSFSSRESLKMNDAVGLLLDVRDQLLEWLCIGTG